MENFQKHEGNVYDDKNVALCLSPVDFPTVLN